MKIAILTNSIATTGGAGMIAKKYNELLEARGHDVRVWGPDSRFDQLGRMNAISRLAFHLRDLGVRDVTAREILDWKPDALLTHNLTGCGFGTPKKIKRGGIRWVHVLHDVQLIEPSGQIVFGESFGFLRAIWRWKWSLLRHLAMGEPDAVVSPTKWLLEFHRRYGWFRKIKTEIIPNPIPPPCPPPCPVEGGGSGSPLLPMNRRGLGVVYVGRVDRDKGILVLLEAWKLLQSDARRPTHDALCIIGDGTLLHQLKSQNIPGVEFLGAQPNDVVRREMQKAAVVVVPSLVLENQPTVILEALASGCTVVASDVGGARETLDGAGTLVPPGDAEALAKAIPMATHDARRTTPVLSHHDPEVCVDRLIGVLRSNA